MKIRSLALKNFRGFAGERSFRLSEAFTVVAGVNGRGKTAVLDGLALLMSRLFRTLTLSSGNQRTIAAADVFGDADNASLAMQANCASVPVEFSVQLRRGSKTVRATRLASAVRRHILQNYGDPSRADDQTPVAIYYTTDRAGLRLPRSVPTELPVGQQLAHNGALSNRMVDYRDFMARYRVWTSREASRERRAFDAALTQFLDRFSDVLVEDRPLRLTVRKGDHRLSLTQLSDGERSFIAMLGDMVRRLALANPDLENPLDGHGVVLIDELELHLHPTWQREVVEKLRSTFPNIQFVGTTHSPFVIQSLRAGELINLDPDEFGEYADKSIEDIAENIMGVDVPQKSERYQRMMGAAEEYFRFLRSPGALAGDVAAAEKRFNELAAPFSDDPAFQALLKLERETQADGGNGATG
jgi:predicted ATP-binding protein involved in virulence